MLKVRHEVPWTSCLTSKQWQKRSTCFDQQRQSNTVLINSIASTLRAFCKMENNSAKAWLRLARLAMRFRRESLIVMACALSATACGWSVALLLRFIVDANPLINSATGFQLVTLGVLITLLLRFGFGLLHERVQHLLIQRIQSHLGLEYIQHVFHLPVSFFDNKHFTDAYARFRELVSIRTALGDTLFTTGLDVIVILSLITILALSNFKLTLVLLICLPLNVIILLMLKSSIRTGYKRMIEASCGVAQRFHDGLIDPKLVKVYVMERITTHRVEEMYGEELKHEFGTNIRQGFTRQLTSFITAVIQVIILWLGAQEIWGGKMSTGELVFFFTLAGLLLLPIERLANLGTALQGTMVAFERFEETLGVEREECHLNGVQLGECSGQIEIRGVTFSYTEGEPVLKNINLTIPAGATVAIIGESGGGKTTLVNLLAGLYMPQAGQILIDGNELNSLNLYSYRKHLGVVFQRTSILDDSVLTNITLRRDNIRRDDAVRAAKIAQADDFICQMPEGYDTELINRDAGLSGGQVQRIGIARAIVGKPKILILDEATSNLDSRTEDAIHGAMEEAKWNCTKIIIAHRFSTIRSADSIIVLDQGRIAEEGTHEQLYEAHGLYYELLTRQIVNATEPLVV